MSAAARKANNTAATSANPWRIQPITLGENRPWRRSTCDWKSPKTGTVPTAKDAISAAAFLRQHIMHAEEALEAWYRAQAQMQQGKRGRKRKSEQAAD